MHLHKKLLVSAVFLLFSVQAFSQLTVVGKVFEASSEKGLDYIQITIHERNTKKLVGYAYSSQSGAYAITIPGPGVYEMSSHSLSHESVKQSIVVLDNEQSEIPVTLWLKAKSFDIEGVEVTASRPPLVVRGDTLVYAAAAFTDEADQTVEDILRKIPGIEVIANGELKVRGKNVDRVLINGEEVADAGAALLTRGIDPRLVRDIEIRMNEQDEKLKKSLLDQNGLIVLDIKLKSDVNKRFGRISAGAGHEQETGLQPGGLLNGFSLGKKANWHIVGEYDRFGHQTINLQDVKNLGREAYAAIFNVPADYTQLRANPEYDKELYGFKEGTRFEQGTAGLSGAIQLGKYSKLYLGTYNALDRTGLSKVTQRDIVLEDVSQTFNETEDYHVLSSKNKLEYSLSLPEVKIRYNINAVLTDNVFSNKLTGNEGSASNFRSDDYERSIYHNLFMEKRLTPGHGIQLKAMYSNTSRNISRELSGPIASLFELLPEDISSDATLQQDAPVNNQRFLFDGFYRVSGKKHSLSVGIRSLYDDLESSKLLLVDGSTTESEFSAPNTSLKFTQWLPYVAGSLSFGDLNWSNKVGYGFNTYSNQLEGSSSLNLLELNSKLTLAMGDDNLNLGYTRSTGQFPLLQQLAGVNILDARTLGRLGEAPLRPQPEEVLQLSYSTWMLEKIGMGIEAAAVAGRSRSGSSFLYEYAPFITETYDQLSSEYAVATLKVAKVFDRLPLQLRVEQSFIGSRQQNRLPEDGFFNTVGNIWLTKVNASTTFKDQPFNFSVKAKRTSMTFGVAGSNDLNSLAIASVTASPTAYLFRRKVLLSSDIRYVNFSLENSSSVWLTDLRLSTRFKAIGFELKAENLFNGQAITTQNFTGGVFERNERLLFGRSIRLMISTNL